MGWNSILPRLFREAHMNEDLKNKIFIFKNEGMSYSNIAQKTGLSINTIKSLFRRQNSKDGKKYTSCKNCGKELNISSNSRIKKFCLDVCRFKWWNKNTDGNRKCVKVLICKNCRRKFKSYDNKARQYCCHKCYIIHRFKNNKECFS